MIRNMGLFWQKDLVQWTGVRGYPAVLLGQRRGEKRQDPINFWGQAGIYALYADYRLVYVGQAGAGGNALLGNRLKAHTRDDLAGRWDRFSWFGFRSVDGRARSRTLEPLERLTQRVRWQALADVVEGLFIEVAEPPLNGQGGRFGRKIHRYLQVRSPYLAVAEVKSPVLKRLAAIEASIADAVESPKSPLIRQLTKVSSRVDKLSKRLSARRSR